MITICNKHTHIPVLGDVYAGRGSPFGNPFPITPDHSRDQVCDWYVDYFNEQIQSDTPLYRAVTQLIARVSKGEHINMVCFCKPRRCHLETIKAYVEAKAMEPQVSQVRLAIVGGRDFNDYALLEQSVLAFSKTFDIDDPAQLIINSGKARGADSLGEAFAREYGLVVKEYPAQWDLYGKRAGYLRNEAMAQDSTHVIAFWDGVSRGTQHMINHSIQLGKVVEIVRYD